MQARLNAMEVAPGACAALRAGAAYLGTCGLGHALLGLVKMRASQINGCAYCLDMHSRAARARRDGAAALSAERVAESPVYSDRERAALAWTECLTRVASQGAPDAEYEALTQQFPPVEIVNLSTAIGMINLWNRLMTATRRQYTASTPAAA